MSLLQPRILEDGQQVVAAVMASSPDWTVVGVPRLTDGHRGDPLRSAPHVGGAPPAPSAGLGRGSPTCSVEELVHRALLEFGPASDLLTDLGELVVVEQMGAVGGDAGDRDRVADAR
jgi:hypothetical protein